MTGEDTELVTWRQDAEQRLAELYPQATGRTVQAMAGRVSSTELTEPQNTYHLLAFFQLGKIYVARGGGGGRTWPDAMAAMLSAVASQVATELEREEFEAWKSNKASSPVAQ